MAPVKSKSKRRRKAGKYTPLVWILTGAVIAFFIAYSSNSFKNLSFWQPPKGNTNYFSLTNFVPIPQIKETPKTNNSVTIPLSSAGIEGNGISVKIFLAVQKAREIQLVEKKVMLPKSSSPLKDVLEALIQYRENDFLNLVPLNTKVRKVWIKNNIAFIDFSDNFSYNSYGITGYKVQIYQIVYTAAQFSQIKAVYFYLEGKPAEYLGGDGFMIHNPIYPFSSLPSFPLR
jgi:spore germination protein GerM